MQPCPRQAQEATLQVQLEHQSHWRDDNTCSYCGGLSPEEFFRAVEAGALIEPTDKNYKAYVVDDSPLAGQPCLIVTANFSHEGQEGWFQVTEENKDSLPMGPNGSPRGVRVGDWTKIDPHPAKRHRKFYFQHLDEVGRQRFIQMHNDKRMNVWGGGFYVTPYFCRPVQQV